MCFKIDTKARRPRNTRVYKVVRIQPSNNVVTSPFKSHHEWAERKTYRIHPDASTRRDHAWWGAGKADWRAEAGFYVLLTREDAERAVKDCPTLTILELDVNPRDWLYTSDKDGAIARKGKHHPHYDDGGRFISATYRRVKVAKRQHYLRWTNG